MSQPIGVIVTPAMVDKLPGYGKGVEKITREDLAREAMRLIHSGGKNVEALKKAQELKNKFGDGISAMCLVYNATGGRLRWVDQKNWSGSIYHQNPPSYFDNGQWIAFLHVRPHVLQGCSGACVFRSSPPGTEREFLVSWNIPLAQGSSNSVHAEVAPIGHFSKYWKYVHENLQKSGPMSRGTNNGYVLESEVGIGGSSTAECIAILRHKFNPLPNEY